MNEHYPFVNPPLPYDYDALEPFIGRKTMELHRDGYLQTYINDLNQTLEKCPEYQSFSLEQLICYAQNMPAPMCNSVLHNAGGAYNHLFYFSILQKNENKPPAGSLADQIAWQFGSFQNFRDLFTAAALSVFGSGYTWLVLDDTGKLAFRTTENQGTLLLSQDRPIICIDVWEHAYYLQYYNIRKNYIDDWFSVINWEQAEQNYAELT